MPTSPAHETTAVTLAIATGLSPGSNIRENRMFQLTPIGAEFVGNISFDQWIEGMKTLRMCSTAAKVWLADFLAKGRQAFGETKVQETLSQLQFTLTDADEALAIASLPRGIRHEKLTSEHYWVIATASLTQAEQVRWAKLALDHSLSPKLLKESIAAGEVITGVTGQNHRGGVATVQAFRQIFDRWMSQVDKSDPIHTWDERRKRALYQELEGPMRVGLQLAQSLGIAVAEPVHR